MKALNAVTFTKFRFMLVMSASTLILVIKKSKEPEERSSRRNRFIVMHFNFISPDRVMFILFNS